MQPSRVVTILLVLICTLPALGGCPASQPEPVEVVLNEDACVICFMAVSSRPFAAQTVSTDGSVEYYDDIGCLVDRAQQGQLPDASLSFVVDLANDNWIDAATATYLWSDSLPTPMSYGIAAFTSDNGATETAAKYPGRLVDWETLVKEFDPGV